MAGTLVLGNSDGLGGVDDGWGRVSSKGLVNPERAGLPDFKFQGGP